jgi:hypothetical protein
MHRFRIRGIRVLLLILTALAFAAVTLGGCYGGGGYIDKVG